LRLAVLLWCGLASWAWAASDVSAAVELRYRDSAGHWQDWRWQGSLEIADTAVLRERGLMNRASLPLTRGMLFIYEEPQDLWFWMKNTTLPLTALALDRQCRVVSARPLVPLSTETVWLGRGRMVVELPRIAPLPDIAFGSRHGAGSLRVYGSHPMLDPACLHP
jgi:uncharacterized membrane protein (UPF0127 family)